MNALRLLYMSTMVNIRMSAEEIAFLDANFKTRSGGIRSALRLAMEPSAPEAQTPTVEILRQQIPEGTIPVLAGGACPHKYRSPSGQCFACGNQR